MVSRPASCCTDAAAGSADGFGAGVGMAGRVRTNAGGSGTAQHPPTSIVVTTADVPDGRAGSDEGLVGLQAMWVPRVIS